MTAKSIATLFLPNGPLLFTYPSHKPTKLCSRPDKKITQRKSISKASTFPGRHTTGCSYLSNISKSKCHWLSNTKGFTVHLPAITVLFPSSTTRGSRDSDESITFPSISLPCTVTHTTGGTRWWHDRKILRDFTAGLESFGAYFMRRRKHTNIVVWCLFIALKPTCK